MYKLRMKSMDCVPIIVTAVCISLQANALDIAINPFLPQLRETR